jgi:hypothetical protein
MNADDLQPGNWYWVRRTDGSLAPYRFHRLRRDASQQKLLVEVYVGSFLQTFPLSSLVAEARMPELHSRLRDDRQ